MKRIAIAVVLAVLLMLAMPLTASAAGITVTGRTGDGAWTNNTWQVEIYPGETKATTIKLYNSSSSSLGVEVSISPSSLDNGNLTFELDKAKFTMPRRSHVDITLSVKASSSTTPGTYTAELEIKSEVPPAPPGPTPPIPEEEPEQPEEPTEPTEPEEPEPVEPEPEEPESVEPEPEEEEPELVEPEVVEPEVVEPEEEEPEVVEPEVIEPGEEEEEEIIVPPGTPWGLIGGLVGGIAAAGGIGYWLWLRRRREGKLWQ